MWERAFEFVADASVLAGMVVDRYGHQLPPHRQHLRMADAGIAVSRSSLTNRTGRTIDLLRAVMEAQSAHVLESRVLAMDEASVKAGRTGAGKMRQAYFSPMYGEDDEMVFHYAPTREDRHVETFLGELRGTLLSDGHEAYAKRHGAVHARCRSRCRRFFEQAKGSEPQAGASTSGLTGGLHSIERDIRRARVEGAAKRAIRESQSAPVAREFFAWCRRQRERAGLLPKALRYALDREDVLSVPCVAIDTNPPCADDPTDATRSANDLGRDVGVSRIMPISV